MENKAKIRYRLMPVFENGMAFQCQSVDQRAANNRFTPDISVLRAYRMTLFSYGLQMEYFINQELRDKFIKQVHEEIAEFAVKWEGWQGDVWQWMEATQKIALPKPKTFQSHESPIYGFRMEYEIDQPEGWYPWSPDMPIPKPRKLGNFTFEV